MAARALWIVLASSLLLKLGLLPFIGALPTFADEKQYVAAALSIAREGVPHYTNPIWDEAHYPPLYPYLLGGMARLLGAEHLEVAVRVLQALLSTATALLVAVLGTRLFDRRTGLLAASVWAFYPAAVSYSHLFLSETLYAFLATAALVVLMLAGDNRSRTALAAGLLAGTASLTRSIFFLQSLCIAGWTALRDRRRRVAAGFLAGLLLTVLPWSARNTLRYGKFLLIDTGAGNVLHMNWNTVDPWNQDIGLIGRYQRDREALKAAGLQRRRRFQPEDPNDIVGRNQGEIRLALAWLVDHPLLFLRHSAIRSAEFLNPTTMPIHRLRLGHYGSLPRPVEELLVALSILATLFVVFGGVLGLVLLTKGRERTLVSVVFLTAFLSAALLMSITRYRFPSLPLIVPFAVALARDPRGSWKEASAPRRTGALLVALALAAIAAVYLPYNYPAAA